MAPQDLLQQPLRRVHAGGLRGVLPGHHQHTDLVPLPAGLLKPGHEHGKAMRIRVGSARDLLHADEGGALLKGAQVAGAVVEGVRWGRGEPHRGGVQGQAVAHTVGRMPPVVNGIVPRRVARGCP